MLSSIILGIVTCLLVSNAFHLINDGRLTTAVVDGSGKEYKRLTLPFTKTGVSGWIVAAVSGVALAAINYFTGKITLGTIGLAWVFMVTTIAGYVALGFLWHSGGTGIVEGVSFALIAITPLFTMKALVGIAAAPWSNNTLIGIFGMLPWALVVGFIAFMVIDLANAKGSSKTRWIAIGAALMAVVLLLLVGLSGCSGNEVRAAETQAVQDLTVRKLTPEDLEKLTLTKYKGIPETLLDSSLSPQDAKRTSETGFSDALTFGFSSKDTEKMFAELQEEILRNPVYGVTVAKALRDKKIGDKPIGDFNAWMDEMVQKNAKGVFYWCEYRDNSGTIYVTEEYRCYAATLCTFLERLVDQGVQQHQTIENWCLNSAAKNNDRMGVKADYQYKKDALVLSYIGKNEAGKENATGLFTVGFNVHDKRPEFFGEEDSPTKPTNPGGGDNPPTPTNPDSPTPTPTNPGPSPTPTKPTPTPTNPTSPTNPPTPTTPTTPYNKDPNKAPSENTEKNDDPGPGPNTNNGEGANKSAADSANNSTNSSIKENQQKQEEQKQKNSNTSNTPSTKTDSGTKVDNNGNSGTGYGGADTKTPAPDPAKTYDGKSVDNPSGNGHLDRVPD